MQNKSISKSINQVKNWIYSKSWRKSQSL